MFDRLNRTFRQAIDPDKMPAKLRQPTLETLLPGDVVSLWDVKMPSSRPCSSAARSSIAARRAGAGTCWTKSLLEVAPDGNVLYERTDILHQASAEFETLTSDPEHGGVLKAFEARVRQGTAARQPTLFEYGGRVYRIVSTGIFEARPAGGPSYRQDAYPKAEVWRDINPSVQAIMCISSSSRRKTSRRVRRAARCLASGHRTSRCCSDAPCRPPTSRRSIQAQGRKVGRARWAPKTHSLLSGARQHAAVERRRDSHRGRRLRGPAAALPLARRGVLREQRRRRRPGRQLRARHLLHGDADRHPLTGSDW